MADNIVDAEPDGDPIVGEEELDGGTTEHVTKHETPIIIQNHVTIPKYSTPDIRVPVEFKPSLTLVGSRWEATRTIIMAVIAATLIAGLFIW